MLISHLFSMWDLSDFATAEAEREDKLEQVTE